MVERMEDPLCVISRTQRTKPQVKRMEKAIRMHWRTHASTALESRISARFGPLFAFWDPSLQCGGVFAVMRGEPSLHELVPAFRVFLENGIALWRELDRLPQLLVVRRSLRIR